MKRNGGSRVEKTTDSITTQSETEGLFGDGCDLDRVGKNFEEDKRKLEDAMERVSSSNIPDSDKKRMLEELSAALDELEKQYDREVAEEEERIQEEIRENMEHMDEIASELAEQEDSLRSVTLDAADTDTSAAADEAAKKRQEIEQRHAEYAEKLRLQIEQATTRQRYIRSRRLSGNK